MSFLENLWHAPLEEETNRLSSSREQRRVEINNLALGLYDEFISDSLISPPKRVRKGLTIKEAEELKVKKVLKLVGSRKFQQTESLTYLTPEAQKDIAEIKQQRAESSRELRRYNNLQKWRNYLENQEEIDHQSQTLQSAFQKMQQLRFQEVYHHQNSQKAEVLSDTIYQEITKINRLIPAEVQRGTTPRDSLRKIFLEEARSNQKDSPEKIISEAKKPFSVTIRKAAVFGTLATLVGTVMAPLTSEAPSPQITQKPPLIAEGEMLSQAPQEIEQEKIQEKETQAMVLGESIEVAENTADRVYPSARGYSKNEVRQVIRKGTASYYGEAEDKCLGCRADRLMANGEVLNDRALTVATAADIPLNSFIRITNTETGKWAIAKVTDRGGFSGPPWYRVSDMSIAVKELLGCGDLCQVEIEIILK